MQHSSSKLSTITVLSLDHSDNIISEKEITLNDIQSMENFEVVRIPVEAMPTISAFKEYHNHKHLIHLKNCYSVKSAKNALENYIEYQNILSSGEYGTIRDTMLIEEIPEDLTLIKLFHTLRNDCNKINFFCKDFSTNTQYRLLLENTTLGISVLSFVHLSNQVPSADIPANHERNTDSIKIIDVIRSIARAIGKGE